MNAIIKQALTVLALCMATISAQAVSIDDGYNGAGLSYNGDVLGNPDVYQITHMEVTYDSANLYVSVFTNFFEGADSLDYKYGDLFISTNGWRPHGTAANRYGADDVSNGEHWEYALDTDTSDLYSISEVDYMDQLVLSGPGTNFRHNQEVSVNTSKATMVAGETSNADLSGVSSTVGAPGVISYTLTLADLGIMDLSVSTALGLRWTTTCANDVIEGGVSVPEPGVFAIFMLGFLSLALSRRQTTRVR
ncbi:PEP-CTERM sorting domain-containing protein [Hahella aquimaris]|uniref:PEP-CTERM sorting domain-containing protein n=1 Tax=Hahella sp. HNIBRBA332 TaxID=3015983 RepID=UPI00273CB0C8|nr:PEP-CTERM sorting domain-containing protein [Hahella sp. HNIBRBA332]WLQ16717.1 PEP-CTERM sorting domain-containing protein [Hahella sp. HNIBRBA332]